MEQQLSSRTAQCNGAACYTCPAEMKKKKLFIKLKNIKAMYPLETYPAHCTNGFFVSSKFYIRFTAGSALLVTQLNCERLQWMEKLKEKRIY